MCSTYLVSVRRPVIAILHAKIKNTAVNSLELVTRISIGKFLTGKQDYLFRRPAAHGNLPAEQTVESCSIYKPIGIFGIFL